MLLKVVGVESHTGSFTDKETGQVVGYDNVIIHGLNVDSSFLYKLGMIAGSRVCEVKVKNEFKKFVYVGEFPVDNWRDLVGCTVDFGQDTDGKVIGLAVVSIDGAQ